MDNSFRSDISGKSDRSKSRDKSELKFEVYFDDNNDDSSISNKAQSKKYNQTGKNYETSSNQDKQQYSTSKLPPQQQKSNQLNKPGQAQYTQPSQYQSNRGQQSHYDQRQQGEQQPPNFGKMIPKNQQPLAYNDDFEFEERQSIKSSRTNKSNSSNMNPVNQQNKNIFDNSKDLRDRRMESSIARSISPIRRDDGPMDTSEILRPILLIDIDNRGSMKLSKHGLEFLQSINTNIAVLSVIGPYRTGKSFLMNRFAGLQRGFQLGASTNPCTKGIWIWGKPIKLKDGLTLLLLDTEGLCSYERDENIDAKLFLLTALISSAMIYNVMNAIDERAIESLSFVANISKHININKSGQNNELSKYFPNLIWVVRDFALELVNKDKSSITPKEYLENALAAVQGDTEEIIAKNKIRRTICDYFKTRDCFTLIRPISDEKLLREMEKVPYDKLRPGFHEQLEFLINKVIMNIRPKIINDSPISGQIFSELLINYIDGLNNQAIPSIPTTMERIIEREADKLLSTAIEYYGKTIKKEVEGKFPINDENLTKIINDITKKGEDILNDFKYSELKLTYVKEKYHKKIKDINDMIKVENQKKSRDFCSTFTQKLLEKLDKDMQAGKLKSFMQFTREFFIYRKSYMEEARGPSKQDIFINQFMDGYLKLGEVFNNNQMAHYEKEKAEIEKKVAEMTGKSEALQQLLKQEKDHAEQMTKIAKERFEEQRRALEDKFQALTDKWESKLEESGKTKDKLEREADQLRTLLAQIKSSGGIDSKKANNIAKVLSEEVSNLDSSLKKDISSLSTNINNLINEIKKINEDRYESKHQYEKEKELQALEKKYQKQLVEAKSIGDLALENLKASYQQEIELLKEENRKLEKSKENSLINLLEKEGQIKILQEKIISYEKEKKTQLDHAEQMMKMSDMLVKVLRKIDK